MILPVFSMRSEAARLEFKNAAARLRHVAGSRWGQKRCLDMDLLKDQDLEEQLEAVSA